MKKRIIINEKVKYRYSMPVEVFFGWGTLLEITRHPLVQTAINPLLVVGNHLKQDGTLDQLVTFFKKEPLVYQPKIGKSSLETINTLANFCRSEKPDLVIAAGGGNILDTAKSASVLANNPGLAEDYLVTKTKAISLQGIPLVTIPTTSGTGSEVTPWATVWDTKNQKKYSLASPLMFSKLAFVDPKLTFNLPPEITASTGMDALTQAIEAYWSKNHNPVSDALALEAIRLIFACLEKAVKKPEKKIREMMSQGSLFSGLAFSNTKTTICHSVSYPITIRWAIPHGQAVAISLPQMILYSLPALGKRQEPLLMAFGVKNEKEAAVKVSLLMEKIGLSTHFSELGIKSKDLDIIVEEGFDPDRAVYAPKVPTPVELKKILEKIL